MISTFVNALLVAIAGVIVGSLVAMIRALARMRRDVARLVKMDSLRAGDLEAIARIQRPILVGVKVSLEAIRDGKSNGNVSDAHREISDSLDKYDSYLASLMRRGR